jgi:hypothetical protein
MVDYYEIAGFLVLFTEGGYDHHAFLHNILTDLQ